MMVLRPDFAAVLNNVDDVFNYLMYLKGEVRKEMKGRRTLRFSLSDKHYYLKAHSGIGWREVFKNLLQLRWPVIGARNEWRAIQRLQDLGIHTMTLVGYGRQGINPAAQRSFVITEELENTRSLEELCAQWRTQKPASTDNIKFKRALIQRIATIARVLHQSGVNHRDFYLCHFLLDVSQGLPVVPPNRMRLYLIDLHRVQLRRHTPRRWIIKDVAALYFSSMDIGLTRRDLYRFIAAYSDTSLRAAFQNEPRFWNKIRSRAHILYRSFHGRDPLPKY